jgi:glyoxylate reductase
LELLKPTAVLINASRGPVVDEAALVSVLKEKRIFGAGLDVYEKEPQLTPGLAELENVVLLPHVGSLTQDTRNQMAIVAAKNAVAMAKKKKPPNLVNPEVLSRQEYLQKVSG